VLLLIVSATALLALVVAVVFWRHRQRVEPLPPAVVTAVEHEKADRARVDSQLIAASLEAAAAQQRQAAAEAKNDTLRSIARRFSNLADSLAHRAATATTAQDSARHYREAYEVRTDERDTLLAALTAERHALDAAEDRIAALTRAVGIADSARQRADSVLDAVVASVTVCTVPGTFGRLKCPSRKTALAVGLVSGLAIEEIGRAVKDGRIRISLPFLRSDRR
jgi:hypothetical protein